MRVPRIASGDTNILTVIRRTYKSVLLWWHVSRRCSEWPAIHTAWLKVRWQRSRSSEGSGIRLTSYGRHVPTSVRPQGKERGLRLETHFETSQCPQHKLRMCWQRSRSSEGSGIRSNVLRKTCACLGATAEAGVWITIRDALRDDFYGPKAGDRGNLIHEMVMGRSSQAYYLGSRVYT